ncbi:T9SS type A sorting domain-containing protein [Flammeovirga sp. SubArs3]|uniref:T9SS type A sorting domain-containing protein n=1 Tax=Flammeovirga sp. SubArs3 TaxID=2995316 RepID=UPI00248B62D7|nr:T9SS type A sorting domain-containing protein [Flammeovirga sp. SubArs3]
MNLNKNFILLVLITLSITITAECKSWIGANGNWSVAGNWEDNSVPTTDDNVEIDCDCRVTINQYNVYYKTITIASGSTLRFRSKTNQEITVTMSGGNISIDGNLYIDTDVILSDDIDIKVEDDDAIITITENGSISGDGIEIKAEGSNSGVDEGPYIYNSGEITFDKLDLGKDGNGELYNYATGIINVSVELHLDGDLCNIGLINVIQVDGTAKLKLHGAKIECGGQINVNILELDDKGDRSADLVDQVISDGENCSGGGDSDTPIYKVDGSNYNFTDLLTEDDDNDNISVDRDNVYSCTKNARNEDLPVELVYFEAITNNDAVELIWETASEENNSHFLIEKSTDKRNWLVVDQIKGMGNSNISISYQLIDKAPYKGISYYRLTQVDFDGSYEIFSPVMISVGEIEIVEIHAFPIPSANAITITSIQKIFYDKIMVFNINGQSVLEAVDIQRYGENQLTISLEKLDNGVYFFKNYNEVVRFVKE